MDAEPLRYADCPTASASIHVDASPAAVWALVSDVQLPARFSSEFLGAEWLEGASGAAPGASFVGRNRHSAIGTWETTATITEYEAERRFGYVIGDVDEPSSAWRFTIEPDDDGDGVRVTQWMQMGPARSGINMAIDAMPDKEHRILERRLAEHVANMEKTLAGVKDLAEAT